jgi:hypothetical protein
MEWVLTREAVIVIAILGGLASVAAGIVRARGLDWATRARHINFAGYVLMGLSMLLFVIVGFRGH